MSCMLHSEEEDAGSTNIVPAYSGRSPCIGKARMETLHTVSRLCMTDAAYSSPASYLGALVWNAPTWTQAVRGLPSHNVANIGNACVRYSNIRPFMKHRWLVSSSYWMRFNCLPASFAARRILHIDSQFLPSRQ